MAVFGRRASFLALEDPVKIGNVVEPRGVADLEDGMSSFIEQFRGVPDPDVI